MNDYQKFIAISRYARWIDEENRRETWEETVDRYVSYMSQKVKGHLPLVQIKDAKTRSYAVHESIDDCRFCFGERQHGRV